MLGYFIELKTHLSCFFASCLILELTSILSSPSSTTTCKPFFIQNHLTRETLGVVESRGFYGTFPISNEVGKLTVNDPNTFGKNVTHSTYLMNNIQAIFSTLSQKIQEFSSIIQSILEEEANLRSLVTWADLLACQNQAGPSNNHSQSAILSQAGANRIKKLLSINLAEDILFNKRYYEVSYQV